MATRIEPYWLEEKDWLVFVAFLPEDDPDERARGAEAIGYYWGYAQLTNTRMLALVGDPECHAYELLFSFASADGKQAFLKLLRSNAVTNYDDGVGPGVPTFEEIRDAQPLGIVLPEDVFKDATIFAATIISGAEEDESVN
jgi:hypothetical protein